MEYNVNKIQKRSVLHFNNQSWAENFPFCDAQYNPDAGGRTENSVKLSEMKLAFCVSDHVPECHKSREGLCEYENGKNYVNSSLQRLYENGFIEELKQD